MNNTTYLVPGMTCQHCETAITEELDRIAGVEAVHVDLEAKLVRVSAIGVDDATVAAAIDEAGYDAVRTSA